MGFDATKLLEVIGRHAALCIPPIVVAPRCRTATFGIRETVTTLFRASGVASIVVILFLSGCAQQSRGDGTDPAQETPKSQGAPQFAGPWAREFSEVYAAATTDKQPAVLDDGVISEEEFSALQKDFVSCVAERGATVTFGADDRVTVDSGSLSDEQVKSEVLPQCNDSTVGSVASLYEQVARNPEHQDDATIIVACLVQKGVVEDSYTPSDYSRDFESDAGLDWNDDTVKSCQRDPLAVHGA